MRRILAALFAIAALALLGPSVALGQATSSFSPTALPASLSVSTSSSRVAFPSPGPTALIVNTGVNNAYLAFGSSSVAATTGGFLLGPGCSTAYSIAGQSYMAAITASSTTTLAVTTGAGLPTLPPNNCTQTITIATGTVTANQGTQNAGGAAAWPVTQASQPLPTGAATSALQTSVGATAHTDSGTINTTLGSPFQAGGTIGNTTFAASQGTASALNATVVGTGTFAVQPSNPIGITPTDGTITSATGSSQTVFALNASRHSLIVQNTGNANCGVNPTGGTAIIGGAATLTLFPGGSYQPRIPTLSAVTAICTSGQPLYAEQN